MERYQLQHRTGIERASSLILTVATLFSLTGLGHEDETRRQARQTVVLQTVPIFSPAEKNETVRMPIKFDDGLRATATATS